MNANRIYEWAHLQPKKTALIYNGVAIDYSTFARAVEAHRLFFVTKNLPEAGTAVVVVGGIADAWFIVLALRALGLNTICAMSMEVAQALDIKNVVCLVTTAAEQARHTFDTALARSTHVLVVPRLMLNDGLPRNIPTPVHGFGGHILCTSGTTGRNKKLLLDARTQGKRIEQQIESRSFSADTVQHCGNFGLWSAAGCSAALTLWHAGGCAVIDQRTDILKHFFDHKITRAWLTPPMLRDLLDLRGNDARPVEDFELSVGSGFLPASLAERALKTLTQKLSMGYASSECVKVAGTNFESEEDLYWLTIRPGRVVEIIDGDGRPCPVDQEGRIRILLTERDCNSYLDDEAATAQFFRDGYFYPGDLAIRRADGKIRILGRADDVLTIQGKKIAAAPLENQMQAFLAAGAVCLFSGLSKNGEDELVIAIEGDHAPSGSQLDSIRKRFGQFERIRVELLKAFPRTEGGTRKVKRDALRQLVFSNQHS